MHMCCITAIRLSEHEVLDPRQCRFRMLQRPVSTVQQMFGTPYTTQCVAFSCIIGSHIGHSTYLTIGVVFEVVSLDFDVDLVGRVFINE